MSDLPEKMQNVTIQTDKPALNPCTPQISMVQYFPNLTNLTQPLTTQFNQQLGQSFSYQDQQYLNQPFGVSTSIEPVSNFFESQLTILEHVFRCSAVVCTTECAQMKIKIHHVMMCTGISCPICNQVQTFFNLHSERCSLPDCPVPDFESLNRVFTELKSNTKKISRSYSKDNLQSNNEINSNELSNRNSNNNTQTLKRSYKDSSISLETLSSSSSSSSSHTQPPNKKIKQQQPQQLLPFVKPDYPNVEEQQQEEIQEKNDPSNYISVTPPNGIKYSSIPSQNIRSTNNNFSVVWIRCNLCGKRRKIPNTIDVKILGPKFKCSINIWDSKYLSCDIPEEIPSDTKPPVIDLSGHYAGYEEEKDNFIEVLKAFHKTHQTGIIVRTPTLGRREVDLYRLFREVTAHGGSTSVILKEGTWARIYRGLDNFSATETSASFRLKKMYTKLLYDYEQFLFNFDNTKDSETSVNRRILHQRMEKSKEVMPMKQKNILCAIPVNSSQGIRREVVKYNNEVIGVNIVKEETQEVQNQDPTIMSNIPSVPLNMQPFNDFEYANSSLYAYCPYYNNLHNYQHDYSQDIQNGWVCVACSQINKETQKYCTCCEALKP